MKLIFWILITKHCGFEYGIQSTMFTFSDHGDIEEKGEESEAWVGCRLKKRPQSRGREGGGTNRIKAKKL